jgi:hypothetical protein
MKAQELLYVLALVACALLATATNQCGGDVGSPPLEADAPDASPDAAPASRVCYAPSTPLRAYACGTEADCTTCPASCTPFVVDAGAGECRP